MGVNDQMTVAVPSASTLIRHGLITTAATMSVGILTAPLAVSYWNKVGLAVLAGFALSILAAIWLVLVAQWMLARKGHQVAGAMVNMLIRLFLPMSVCLAVVVLAGDGPTKNAVFLCVPMYVTMLAVDTFQAIAAIPKTSRKGRVSPTQAVSCSGLK